MPPLCSRVFRKRRGTLQSPRNVFLHGRGGARNMTCLYRFEAVAGERVSSLYNVLLVFKYFVNARFICRYCSFTVVIIYIKQRHFQYGVDVIQTFIPHRA